eukprot:GHVT01072080.1.p1 GENE.GHVT01072080.1~~GHVT01072080.1.p1  ORF type:complete len:486 (+),score=37.56 GHVT01072080.1:501-1958(+)
MNFSEGPVAEDGLDEGVETIPAGGLVPTINRVITRRATARNVKIQVNESGSVRGQDGCAPSTDTWQENVILSQASGVRLGNIKHSVSVYSQYEEEKRQILRVGSLRWFGHLFSLLLKIGVGGVTVALSMLTAHRLGRSASCGKDLTHCTSGGILHNPVLFPESTPLPRSMYYEASVHLVVFSSLLMLTILVDVVLQAMHLAKPANVVWKSYSALTSRIVLVLAIAAAGGLKYPRILLSNFCGFGQYVWPSTMPTFVVQGAEAVCDSSSALTVVCELSAAGTIIILTIILLVNTWRRFFIVVFAINFFKYAAGIHLLYAAVFYVRTREHFAETAGQTASIVFMLKEQSYMFYTLCMAAFFSFGFMNIAAGLFGLVSTWLKSKLFIMINILVNFVYAFAFAVGSAGLLMNSSLMRFFCSYENFPVDQGPESRGFARALCLERTQFYVCFALVALSFVVYFIELFVDLFGTSCAMCQPRDWKQRQSEK